MEVVNGRTDVSGTRAGVCDYFDALCRQSFPGPLAGGNVGAKELNKWTDERLAHCESPDMDYRKGEVLRLLLSLLKIALQHYGKLRSPFGTDTMLKVNNYFSFKLAFESITSIKDHDDMMIIVFRLCLFVNPFSDCTSNMVY